MSSHSFFRLLEALQKKPNKEKDRIIIATVSILMLIIVGIWISLPGGENSESQTTEQQAGPFKILWQEIKENAPDF